MSGRFVCHLLRSYDHVPFAEQAADLSRMLNTLPIARLSIDKTGIGMNLAENLGRAFPQVAPEAFTSASKERWCTTSRSCSSAAMSTSRATASSSPSSTASSAA